MINKLNERLDQLEQLINSSTPDDEAIEKEYHSIKNDFEEIKDYPHRGKDVQVVRTVSQKLKQIRKEYDFYDEEAELDMMFPNRHDEDFDEDSYSNMFEG
jgi:uncharacterized protein (UPF0335 family)